VSLYANDSTGRRLIGTKTLPAVPMGMRIDGVTFDVAVADIGRYGFVAVVDDDGTGNGDISECNEDNNEDAYTDVLCP
jgi:hypothetical protein